VDLRKTPASITFTLPTEMHHLLPSMQNRWDFKHGGRHHYFLHNFPKLYAQLSAINDELVRRTWEVWVRKAFATKMLRKCLKMLEQRHYNEKHMLALDFSAWAGSNAISRATIIRYSRESSLMRLRKLEKANEAEVDIEFYTSFRDGENCMRLEPL